MRPVSVDDYVVDQGQATDTGLHLWASREWHLYNSCQKSDLRAFGELLFLLRDTFG
jgi:hypothetical protein